MKKINYNKYLMVFAFLGSSLIFSSCFNDLDTVPLDPDEVTSGVVFDDPNAYKQVLAKLYAGLAVSGQQGPSGQADIAGIDEGFGQYLRALYYHQEFPTDEALIGWNDQTIKDYHDQDWDANDVFIAAFYSRIFYQIPLCNEFLRETTQAKLSERGVGAALATEIDGFRAEARFLRALSYWHALDHFGSVPFVTEDDKVGAFFPTQISEIDLYNFIESELKEIETQLPAAGTNEYARADQGAAWMLLAKLYLNAKVYTGTEANDQCIVYCDKLIGAGYSLEPNYEHLFRTDNHLSNEIIFPIAFDGVNTRTWGGMTFLTHAGIGGSMNASEYGIDGGWGGIRTTKEFVGKFPSVGSPAGGTFVVERAEGASHTLLYMPGSYQGWDPSNAETVLSSPSNDGIFEGFKYFAEDDTQFKFATMPNWDVNYGDSGADGVLDEGGDNIIVADAGLYRFVVNTNDLTYTIEKTDWGLIGDATPGGWDDDTDMVFDPEDGSLVLNTVLTAGEIKFRANDGWDLNYGDTGADALLEAGGDNIKIENGGNYQIRLYLNRPDYSYSLAITSSDGRALIYTDGQNLEIEDISQFTEGYAITKFQNVDRDGVAGSDLTFPDTDFPMFRLADVYLMYAEATLRGGAGGNMNTALEYVNLVRARAYGGSGGEITSDELDLPFILDERSRELFWECHRRTDLVRFEQLTGGDYLWAWKGGVKEGAATNDRYNIFPIPTSDLTANPNLEQNKDY